ncbi:MAG: cellulase family glycosylhydrolase [Puniceicoccaceae bacterium]
MKPLIITLISILSLTSLHAGSNPNGFSLNKGVNISHWLSQRGERPREDIQTFFTEFDVIMLKQAGFDHLRIPIDEVEFWDDNGKAREDAWAALDRGLTWCQRHDLNVIVDLHIIRSHYFNVGNDDNKEQGNTLFEDPREQEKFVQLWDEISDRIGHFPVDRVAYEFMNEAVGDDPEDWNRLLQKVYGFMREKEPTRTFVLGSFQFQSIDTLSDLWVPEGDRNLVISIHTYDPFVVTHYKAGWTPFREYQGPINYPGLPFPEEIDASAYSAEIQRWIEDNQKPYSYEAAVARLKPVAEFMAKHNLPMYCGEWGCYLAVPREMRLDYYRDWIRAFETLNIAQAIWDYKGGFRIVNDETREIDHELIDILMAEY